MSSAISNAGYAIAKLGYQISPIILTNGLASAASPLGMLPIVAITEAINFTAGLLSGADIGLDDFFANFVALPGSTMLNNAVGTYPFANQAVAANAIITEPLNISMMMLCPVRASSGGFATKLATMMLLQAALEKHNNLGGTYTIVTPSFIYTDCLLTRMTDVSGGESKQVQWQWQLDFFKPLLSLSTATTALGRLMNQLTTGSASSSTAGPVTYGVAPAAAPLSGTPALVPTGPSSLGYEGQY
jgi:hypothetical protein